MDRTKITLAVAGLAAGAGLALAYSKYVAKKTEVPVLAAAPPLDLEELERLREENVSSPCCYGLYSAPASPLDTNFKFLYA
jgi:hypothetical protein